MGSKPCTRTWRCSTISHQLRTSSPDVNWPGRVGCHGRAAFCARDACPSAQREIVDRLGITLPDFDAPVALMSGGQRQAVAVARAVAFSSKLVILDEPTAALGLRESRRVLDLIQRLKSDGIAVILISHSMDHVMAVADRAVVLRRGRTVGELVPSSDNLEQLVAWIVGAADCHSTDDEQHAQKEIHMKVRRLLAVGAGLALVAAGCGDDDDADSPPATTEAVTPATEAPATEAPATEAPATSEASTGAATPVKIAFVTKFPVEFFTAMEDAAKGTRGRTTVSRSSTSHARRRRTSTARSHRSKTPPRRASTRS